MFKRFPAWRWRGRSRQGLALRGLAFSPPPALRLKLWEQGVHLISARKILHRPLKGKELLNWQLQFTRNWAAILHSGISQLDALELLLEQAQHPQVEVWLKKIQQGLHNGLPIHQSFRQSGAGFSEQYCRLVEVGEQSGQLPQILKRLIQQNEQRTERARAFRKALTYPFVVLLVATSIVLAMLYFVVPQFAQLYTQMDIEIPSSTAKLLSVADALKRPSTWLWLTPVLCVAPFLRLFIVTASRNLRINTLLYRLPFIGNFLGRQHLLQDISTLNLAYSSNLPLTDACQLTARSSVSALLKTHWQQSARMLAQGSSLYEILQQNPLFTNSCLQRVRLGEQSGQLSNQLDHLTITWSQQLDDINTRILKSLEPIFLIITGAVTAVILLALYIPLFQLGQLVG